MGSNKTTTQETELTLGSTTGNEYIRVATTGANWKQKYSVFQQWLQQLKSDTYANWQTAQGNGTLPAGQWIKITDRGDTGLIIFCTTSDQFGLSGFGGFLNPDFQNVGNYSGTTAVTGFSNIGTLGVWSLTNVAIIISTEANGNVVFWNGFHYQVIDWTAVNGTNPLANVFAYQMLPKNATKVGYIEEWDTIEYDFVNDFILERQDKRANSVSSSFISGLDAIDSFQWGNNAVLDNIIEAGSIYVCLNQKGSISGNLVINGSNMTSDNNHAGTINNNIFSGIAASSIIDKNTGQSLLNCTIETILIIIDPTVGDSGYICESGFSNFECTIDITGLTTLDITTANNYCGIINLTSSNAAETIDIITNIPTAFPFILYPASGLALTLTGTPVASAGAGDIVLPTTAITLNGTNGDWIELKVDRGLTGYSQQIDAQNYI